MIKTNRITELRDSRIFYEKDLPSFGIVLVSIIALLLCVVVCWSTKAKKNYMVHGNGAVQSTNKNFIMPVYTGKITEIFIQEGSYVNVDDLIVSIKSTEIELQQEQYEGQLLGYQKEKKQYEKLLESIKNNVNLFDETKVDDLPYYYLFEHYKSQIAEKDLDTTSFSAYGYTTEQIQKAILQNQSVIDQVYYSTLQGIAEKITELENNIQNIQVQLDALANGENDYSIYAPTSGIVHMDTAYKAGMVVSAGAAIGSIANENDEYEIVAYISLADRPLIHEGDPCKIAVSGLNQSIYGTLNGTVTSIESDITSISGNDGSNNSYFKIHVTPENTYLISKNGEKVSLSNGMSVETRVQYDEVTYFDYVMEAIGALTR